MSQAGLLSDQTSSSSDIETITGNSGGAVGPDGAFNISILGDNTQGINIVGTPASNLLTVSGINATTSQIGVSEFADGTETTTGTDGTRSVTPLGLASKLGAQTANGLAYGNGTTNAIEWLAEATDGQLPIGSTGNPPVLATLTAGTGVGIVNAAGSITISASAVVATQYTCDGATTATPAGNNLNVFGDATQGITTAGATDTITVSASDATTTQKGVTEYADGTETTTGTDGTRSVTPLGLASKLGAQTSNGLAYGNGTTGAIQWLAEATDGQIPIGQTGGVPVLSTLTAGTGVSITNAAGSITISADSEVQGTVQTTDATPTTLLSFDMGAAAGSYLAEMRVAAHNTTDTASAAYFLIGAARTTGAAGTEVASEVSNALEDAAMSTADCTFVVSGNNMIIQVTGIAGKTIEWSGELEYRFAQE